VRLKNISKEFEGKLAEFSAGVLSSDEFEKLINIFESEINRIYFTASSEANLIRIIQGMYDKVFLIIECTRYPHYVEILVSIAANSNYLTEILIINPEYFYWIVNPSTLKTSLTEVKFKKEVKSTFSLFNSFNARINALKTMKRKELLRIGLRDIYLKTPTKDITNELSILASCLTSELFSICYKEVLKKYAIENSRGKYCLVALGKLGGGELNYSSDIDLILFYDNERKIRNKKYLSEILTETTHLFLRSSAEGTGRFLYRIDFRLRPDGRNSPLCRSLQEYLSYYESRGEDWERQMLIKANFLCGSKSLYNKFRNFLTPFIYPTTFSVSPRKQILKMKANIEIRIKDEENIKLIHGGIRDIEFSIQALQLLNGGRTESIRNGNTLEAIKKLEKTNLLNREEAKIFTDAYIFYRKIEHYLQLMNDRQTHVVPDEGELLEKMSYYLGYKNSKEFKKQVIENRNKVRGIYQSVLSEEENSDDDRITLADIHFDDETRAKNDFQFLREGKGIIGARTFDSKSIESFRNIEKQVYVYLKNSICPDQTLSNFVRVIKGADFPSIWYKELLDETFFKFLMRVCELSQFSINLFAEDKVLREFFLSRKIFMKIPIEELSRFNIKTIRLYLAVQITVSLLDPLKASDVLSTLIHIIIKKLFEEQTKKMEWKKDYFVAALGSLGPSALTFFSDLDLIFIIRNSHKYSNIEKHFQKVLTLLRKELKPFTVDCRLRPEGKSSQLVWDVENAKDYFNKRARVWEFQSLTKIAFITGNERIFNSFVESAVSSISKFDKKDIKREIIDMRKKFSAQQLSAPLKIFDVKKSNGSLTDIEFISQYFLLCNQDLFVKAIGKTTREQLELISNKGISKSDVAILKSAFNFYKIIGLLNQTIFNNTTSKIVLEDKNINGFNIIMNYKDIKQFKAEVKSYLSKVGNIYLKIFN
jgi:[glutamine synthetase] adenylyltransferase / [glutamine synthetase]-adenylyl-L-tyrosine phosphorylase